MHYLARVLQAVADAQQAQKSGQKEVVTKLLRSLAYMFAWPQQETRKNHMEINYLTIFWLVKLVTVSLIACCVAIIAKSHLVRASVLQVLTTKSLLDLQPQAQRYRHQQKTAGLITRGLNIDLIHKTSILEKTLQNHIRTASNSLSAIIGQNVPVCSQGYG